MMYDIELQKLANGILNVLDAWVTEFHHFVAIGTDQMIMLPVTVGFFVLCQIFPKLMLCYQFTFHQQIQRIIYRSSADPVILVLHADVERLYIKMTVPGIDLFQNCVPLRCLSQRFLFQKPCQQPFYLIKYDRLLHLSTNIGE